MTKRFCASAATVVVLTLLTGCGASAVTKTAGSTVAPGTTLAAGTTTVPGPTTVPGSTAVSDVDNGKTVTMVAGQLLTVTLHSTYWQFGDPSDPAVIAPKGDRTAQACANGPSFPGSGCGTVMQQYQALRAGTAVLTASRQSCGEALLCRPDQRNWRLTVTVR